MPTLWAINHPRKPAPGGALEKCAMHLSKLLRFRVARYLLGKLRNLFDKAGVVCLDARDFCHQAHGFFVREHQALPKDGG